MQTLLVFNVWNWQLATCSLLVLDPSGAWRVSEHTILSPRRGAEDTDGLHPWPYVCVPQMMDKLYPAHFLQQHHGDHPGGGGGPPVLQDQQHLHAAAPALPQHLRARHGGLLAALRDAEMNRVHQHRGDQHHY